MTSLMEVTHERHFILHLNVLVHATKQKPFILVSLKDPQ